MSPWTVVHGWLLWKYFSWLLCWTWRLNFAIYNSYLWKSWLLSKTASYQPAKQPAHCRKQPAEQPAPAQNSQRGERTSSTMGKSGALAISIRPAFATLFRRSESTIGRGGIFSPDRLTDPAVQAVPATRPSGPLLPAPLRDRIRPGQRWAAWSSLRPD